MPRVLLVADGDAAGLQALTAGLAGAGVADSVLPCDTGRKLVSEYTRALRGGSEVVGVVLDTRLPAGGGKSSAIALRAIEKAFGVRPVGFVFHTAAPRDENLERVLAYLGRSAYRQRGADPGGPQAVAEVVAGLQEVRGS